MYLAPCGEPVMVTHDGWAHVVGCRSLLDCCTGWPGFRHVRTTRFTESITLARIVNGMKRRLPVEVE